MRTLLAGGLVVLLALNAQVRAQNSKPDDKQNQSQNAGKAKTIHGVITGVTNEGEAVFNYDTDKGTVSRVTFLTILGAPGHGHGQNDTAAHRDAKDTNRNETARSESHSEHAMRHWNNVYYVAITPQTKVCMEGEDKDKAKESSASNDTAKLNAALQKIELGEHVVVEFTPLSTSGNRTSEMRHGRERTHRGQATSVEILKRDTHNDNSSTSASRDNTNSSKK